MASPSTRTVRTMCEALEGRQLMSPLHALTAIPDSLINPVLAEHKALNHVNAKDVASVLPLTITSVAVQDGQLVATGKLGDTTFTDR
jgi:hypothetical protein